MRILLANKFYYRRGGDCIYMLNLEQLLKEHGHEVAVFAMDYPENFKTDWERYFPSEIRFRPGKGMVEAFLRPFGTKEVARKFRQLIADFRPEVVHLNNIHSQLSPIIAELAHQERCRVVWTLHDYKLLCPRYDCLKASKEVCECCFGKDKTPCKKFKCMKDSAVASWLAYKEAVKWNCHRLEACTDVFICPSGFMADKMRQGGFDDNKLVTLCNFVDTAKCAKNDYDKGEYYCYIGRLSHEKGVRTLVEAANTLPYPLKIIGGGPLMEELKSIIHPHIEMVGFQQWEAIKELVGKARFMVIPSEWYENNPLSVIEAECLGTPVLGARIGGIPELIQEGKTGMTFASGNVEELKAKIEKMYRSVFDYKRIAADAMQKYDSVAYYNRLMEIYNDK